jgi:trigger factor
VVKEDSDIEFSMETTDESGEPVRNLTAEKRYYTLGQQFMPEGFDQALLGMKAGETREFDFELPESNDPDSPMHKMHCKVTMASVKRRIVPAITDAWVEVNIPEAKNVPGLRELIRQQGEEQLAKEIENRKFFAVAAELATRFQGSIADEVYEFTRGELMRDLTQSIQQQGMTLQEFMKQQGMEEQQFSMQMMMEVRETLRQGFSLDALARHLGLTVTDEDINDTLTRMAPGREEQVRREFEGTGRMYMLREAAMRTKANKWLYDTATFEYVDASQFAPMM